MLEAHEVLWIAFVLLLGAFAQGVIGFGVGLISIPLLILGGIPLPAAIAIMLVTMCYANAVSSFVYRKHICWPTVTPVLITNLVGLPIGVLALYALDGINPELPKSIVGCFVLLAVLSQWFFKCRPREKLHASWGWAAGFSSGFIEGMVGMGSPPLVLYIMAHNWDVHKARTTIWVVFLADILPLLLLLWYTFGHEIVHATFWGVVFFPVTFVGTRLGNKIGHAIGIERLRRVAYVMLLLLGLITVVIPLVHWAQQNM